MAKDQTYLGYVSGANTAVTSCTVNIVVAANEMFKGHISFLGYSSGGQTPCATLTDGTNIIAFLCPGFGPGANIIGGDSKWVELPPGTYTLATAAATSGTVASTVSYGGSRYRL